VKILLEHGADVSYKYHIALLHWQFAT
jgi:hypothetical protein